MGKLHCKGSNHLPNSDTVAVTTVLANTSERPSLSGSALIGTIFFTIRKP
jgi:hypothetical protein